MKNGIYLVNSLEAEKVRKETEKMDGIFLVTIDGAFLQSWLSFLKEMIKGFKLPMKETENANAYLDWMTDLDWLKKDGYVLLIENSNVFMKNDPAMKERILKDFSAHILPFWDSEVEQVVVDGKTKKFDVYLVE